MVARIAPVLVFLIAVTVIAELADKAKVFDVAAREAAHLARGRVWRLWLLVVVLATGLTIVLSLDTCAVLLTPVVLAMARQLDIPPKLFAFTTVWLAGTASLLLPVSNLTNLLALHQFRQLNTPYLDGELAAGDRRDRDHGRRARRALPPRPRPLVRRTGDSRGRGQGPVLERDRGLRTARAGVRLRDRGRLAGEHRCARAGRAVRDPPPQRTPLVADSGEARGRRGRPVRRRRLPHRPRPGGAPPPGGRHHLRPPPERHRSPRRQPLRQPPRLPRDGTGRRRRPAPDDRPPDRRQHRLPAHPVGLARHPALARPLQGRRRRHLLVVVSVARPHPHAARHCRRRSSL